MTHIYDVIIVGSGPGGLMAAVAAEKRKLSYLVIDKNAIAGKKLLITGASRCNVTNPFDVRIFIEKLSLKHKRFLYSTLSSFGTNEVKQFIETNGVELVLENDLKYFPKSSKSIDILNVFLRNINLNNIRYNQKVIKIQKQNDFIVTTDKNEYYSKNVILATGSRSFPITGSTGEGVSFAKKFGHTIYPFYPAETHVYSNQIKEQSNLIQGISFKNVLVKLKGTKIKEQGDILFTHFGLSGPVIQSLSEHIYHQIISDNSAVVMINISSMSINELRQFFASENEHTILQVLDMILPKRFSRYFMTQFSISNGRVKDVNDKHLEKIIEQLVEYKVLIQKVEDVSKAYVNGGGVSTKEINPKTMESKNVSGLYFVGEMIDVHGPIGGFNITIAMSTGYTAANSINMIQKK